MLEAQYLPQPPLVFSRRQDSPAGFAPWERAFYAMMFVAVAAIAIASISTTMLVLELTARPSQVAAAPPAEAGPQRPGAVVLEKMRDVSSAVAAGPPAGTKEEQDAYYEAWMQQIDQILSEEGNEDAPLRLPPP